MEASSYGFGPNEGPAEGRRRDHILAEPDFLRFLGPLHREFTSRQQQLVEKRARVLASSHAGLKQKHLPVNEAVIEKWNIEVPEWCEDQRNQMTGPADDAELVVKMLNSGAPGIMLDLEDSMANFWPNLTGAIDNIIEAMRFLYSEV